MNFETDIAVERLVVAKGIELKKTGKVLTGRCPFANHDDNYDALLIDPKANTWTCHAGCGSGGVVAWVARVEGVSPSHAVELLKADFTPDSKADAVPVKKSTTTKLSTVIEPDEPDDLVLRRVLDFYADTLKSSPKALKYLQGRGLRDPDLVTHFHLGFSDRTLGYRLPAKNRQAGAAIRAQLQRLGIHRESGHEHFRGAVIVPFTDITGKVVQVYGRKINDDLRAGTEYHVTLTDDDHGVFNPAGFVEGQKIILTSSVTDALTWWSSGFRNVTTTLNKPTLPKDVKSLMVAKSIRSVTVAFPREKDTEALQGELREMGIEVHQVVFPAGLDANDVARNAEDAKEALGALLRVAHWVSPAARQTTPEKPPGAALEPTPPKEPEAVTEPTDQVVIVLGDRRWRVRGLDNNTSHGSMRVNILVSKGDAAAYHVDVIELYSARQRRAFLVAAAEELDTEQRVLKADLGKVLLRLEEVRDERLRAELAPEKKPVEIDEADRQAALSFLRQPDLLDRILADFETLGIVGEANNKIVAYLAATSRKMSTPLAVVIQSSSAAGKSSLMEAVLRLIPDEDRLSFSAMTGRSLYYLGADALSHKVLSIAEEEGASQASYALKVLQSEGHLTIASTGKEAKTGRLTTQTYEVSGPVALLMTTTAIDIDEELLSRCLVLTVDEGREQTKAIHQAQRHRQTLDGLMRATAVERVTRLHHNAQRLLRKFHVVIPEAFKLRFADHALRSRRDHSKFLGLIQAVALLRQYQKPVKDVEAHGVRLTYIEADEEDIRIATKLVQDVLCPARTLDDLPPGTRRLLDAIDGHVVTVGNATAIDTADVRFTRRELRENLAWGDTQLKVHLRRLVDFEFLVVHRAGQGRRLAYELAWQGEAKSEPTTTTATATTPDGRGHEAHRSGLGRGSVGLQSGDGRPPENGRKSKSRKASTASEPVSTPEKVHSPPESSGHHSPNGTP